MPKILGGVSTDGLIDATLGFRHGGTTTPSWTTGTGTPEGAVTAPVGSLYSQLDGGADTTFYRKETGTGNTGWVVTSSGGGGGDLYVDIAGDTMTGVLKVGDEGIALDPTGRVGIQTGGFTDPSTLLYVGYQGGGTVSAPGRATGVYTQPANDDGGEVVGFMAEPVSLYDNFPGAVIGFMAKAIYDAPGTLPIAVGLKVNEPRCVVDGSTIERAVGVEILTQKADGVVDGFGIYQYGENDINAFMGPIECLGGYSFGGIATPSWTSGAGTPEGSVAAAVGSIFSRTDGGVDTTFYRKETGTGNTGWAATGASGGGGAVTSVDGRAGVVTLSDLYVDITGDNMTGNLGLGEPAPTAKLHFAASTAAAGGIRFGSDTNLFRSAVGVLHTDTGFQSGGRVEAALNVTTGGFRQGASGPEWLAGANTPEGAVTAPIGSLFSRTNGAAGTAVYRKETGGGNTGWVAIAGGVASVDGRTGVIVLSDLYVDITGDNMTGNLGLGFPTPTSKLQFAADTVAAGGIAFGTDTNLYRVSAQLLRTDGGLQANGRIEAAQSVTNGGFRQGASGPLWIAGTGTPEGVATAPIGSIFSRTNGAANTALYRKETGTGNTGWAAITSGVSSVDGLTGAVDLTTKYVELAGDTMTGQLHTPILSTGAAPAQQGAIRLTNAEAIWSRNNSDTGDLRMMMLTATHVLQLGTTGTTGVGIANAGTGGSIRTLWVSNDTNPTTAAGGISFGSSADTNLYRSAADTLKTDDSLYVIGSIGVGTGPNTVNRVDVNNAATHTSGFGSMALRATNAWQTASNSTGYLTGGIHIVTGNIGVGVTLTNAASDAVVAHTGHASIMGDGTYAVVANAVMGKVTKSGAGTLSEARSFLAFSPDSTGGGTISIATGLDIEIQKMTGVTTGYGVHQRGASDLNYFAGYVGLGINPPTARLHFASATTAAGGILFGTDVNLYRSTTDVLKTDDSLSVGVRVDALSGFRHGSSTAPSWTTGAGTPEGAVAAPIGSIFSRTDGSTGTALYRKEAGTGNTGWAAVATGGGGVTSVDGRSGVVTLSDLYVDVIGDTMTGQLTVDWAQSEPSVMFGTVLQATATATSANATSHVAFGARINGYRTGAFGWSAGAINGARIEAANNSTGAISTVRGIEVMHGGNAGHGTITTSQGIVVFAPTGTGTITNSTGIFVGDHGRTGAFDAMGIHVAGQTIAANYGTGVRIDMAQNRTLWISGDTQPTADNGGIHFGSASDTKLYRAAAGRLRIDNTLTVGPNAATTGVIAIANNTTIMARNFANNADLSVVTMNASNQIDIGTSAIPVLIKSTLSLGVNPAATGTLRLATTGSIMWRNAANTADAGYLALDASDNVVYSSTSWHRFYCAGTEMLSIRSTGVFFGEGTNFSAGTTTGTKFGTATTQKLGWWNATPVVQNAGWSATAGYTATKTFNPESTTLTEVARVLGTLLDALKSYGVLG